MTTVSPTLHCSTRSEMIDLRVVGWRCWANRPDPRAVTTTIPDDLWPEALAGPSGTRLSLRAEASLLGLERPGPGRWTRGLMIRLFRTEHRVDTDVDISSVAFWRQPFAVRDLAFARLRAERPVSWHPALETPGYDRSKHREAGFWAVTTAEDIAYVSRHHELFSSELGQVNLRPAPFAVAPNMLVLDPPAHGALRRAVSSAFTPRAVARLQRMIERRSRQIVARAAAREEFDFVRDVAAQLPLRTIADLFGLPPSEHDAFVVAADAYVGSGFPARLPPGI